MRDGKNFGFRKWIDLRRATAMETVKTKPANPEQAMHNSTHS